MTILGVLTLLAIGLIVVAVALYLIIIALRLRKTQKALDTVNVGVRAIARRVEPLEPILSEVNADLSAVRDALAGVLARKGASV